MTRSQITTRNARIRHLRALGLLDEVEEIMRQHGVSVEAILSPRRDRRVSMARHHTWAQVREQRGLTYRSIGALFGAHETSVCDGVDSWLNRQARVA